MQVLEKEKKFLNVSGKNIKEIRKKQKSHKKTCVPECKLWVLNYLVLTYQN